MRSTYHTCSVNLSTADNQLNAKPRLSKDVRMQHFRFHKMDAINVNKVYLVTYEKYGGPYLPYVCQDGRGLMTGLWDFLSKFG